MKKIIRSIKKAGQKVCTKTVAAVSNTRASGSVDQAVLILTSVVIGALVLAGLYTLFGDTVLPTLQEKIEGLFNYAG